MDAFSSSATIDFEVEGILFKLRELTGGEVNNLTDEYVSFDSESKPVISLSKRNEAVLKRTVVSAPFDCQKLDSEGNPVVDFQNGKPTVVSWENASGKERLSVLLKLRPKIFQALVKIARSMNDMDEAEKKN